MDADTIVIGSGAGGLTAALALAKAGQDVIVLERNEQPGGFSQSIELGGFRFSPGVHYLGELGCCGRLRNIFEGLGIASDVRFRELDPAGYDRIQIGRERVSFPAGSDRLAEHLSERFPHEAEGIRRYFKKAYRLADSLRRDGWTECPRPAPSRASKVSAIVREGTKPFESFVTTYVDDPMLVAVLSAQAGDHGMPTSEVPTAMHLAVQGHYWGGAWYPKGGAGSIPTTLVRHLRAAGGRLELQTPVTQILVEHGRAIGVRLHDGRELRSASVISNADPVVTWNHLIHESDRPRKINRRMQRVRMSCSTLSLYLGVDMDLRDAGMTSGNVWYSRDLDIDAIYRVPRLADLSELSLIPGLFVAATTLKDPDLRSDGLHTLEVIAFASGSQFSAWDGLEAAETSGDYISLKARTTDAMLLALEEVIPGVSKNICFQKLHTPLDQASLSGSTGGNIYGTEKTLRNLGPFSFPVNTSIKGLYQCGASTTAPGILGVSISGLRAAAGIMECETDELLDDGAPSMKLLPASETGLAGIHE